MVALATHRAFCAVCIDGHGRLARRRLDAGGPLYWVCDGCDREHPEPPARRKPRSPLSGRQMSDHAELILRTVQRLGWSSSIDIRDALGIRYDEHDRKEMDSFSAMLSRLSRKGFLERRDTPGLWPDYRLSELGAAALGISSARDVAPASEPGGAHGGHAGGTR